MKKLNTCAVFAAAGMFFCPATSRSAPPPPTAATGVYDETTTQQNNVDFNATGNSTTASTGNGAVYTTVGPFNLDVAAAFVAGRGGVAVFDDLANGTSSTALNVTYASGTKQFNMTFSSSNLASGYTVSSGQATADSAAISDSHYLEPSVSPFNSPQTLTISLSSITGASLGETGFSQVGITLLSGDIEGNPGTPLSFGSITVTATFSDNSTANASRTIGEGKGAGDTFYGFVAPSGLTIASLTVTTGGVNGVPDIDDFGFITNLAAVPEPSTWVLPAFVAATLTGVRLRRRRA